MVIDTCGYQPEIVRRSLTALQRSVSTYVFVSTASVYGEFTKVGITEQDPIKCTGPGEQGDYGMLKADCENVVSELMRERALIVRPGLIVGPYDPSDRFTYWPARVAKGGTILAPGRAERVIQFIDVRDLAAWLIKLSEANERGIYNAKGPRERLTMGDFLKECQQTVNCDCEFVWMDDDFLVKNEVKPWTELPLWIPESDRNFTGFMQFDCRKAFDSGLTSRPVAETIADTLAWDATREASVAHTGGLLPDREAELLDQFRVKNA